jgi:hypothetical protein
MRALVVEVGPESEQFVPEIASRPEQQVIPYGRKNSKRIEMA